MQRYSSSPLATAAPALEARASEFADHPDRLITAAQLRQLTGLSDVSIWRRLADPESNFPRPIYLSRSRRAWRLGAVLAWIERQASAAAELKEANRCG